MIEYLQVSLAMFSTLVFVKRPLVQNCKEKELGISLMHETHRVSGQRKHQDMIILWLTKFFVMRKKSGFHGCRRYGTI